MKFHFILLVVLLVACPGFVYLASIQHLNWKTRRQPLRRSVFHSADPSKVEPFIAAKNVVDQFNPWRAFKPIDRSGYHGSDGHYPTQAGAYYEETSSLLPLIGKFLFVFVLLPLSLYLTLTLLDQLSTTLYSIYNTSLSYNYTIFICKLPPLINVPVKVPIRQQQEEEEEEEEEEEQQQQEEQFESEMQSQTNKNMNTNDNTAIAVIVIP